MRKKISQVNTKIAEIAIKTIYPKSIKHSLLDGLFYVHLEKLPVVNKLPAP